MKTKLILLILALFSLNVFGQIQQNDTTICLGDLIVLNASSNITYQSCTGQSTLNYSTWTEIAPTDSYANIIKEGSTYYLRSQDNVYQAASLNGPWTSLNFNTQFSFTCASQLLGLDQLGRLHIASCHDGLFYYDGATWINNAFAGFGTTGQYFTLLDNGRIIMSKGGFLRSIYYSDNNGASWTNATNIDVDWAHITLANNGVLFACSADGGTGQKGLIKSTDNGSSWSNINSQLNITTSSAIAKDCEGNVWCVGDNKIFKTLDGGATWIQQCLIPSYFTSNPLYAQFIVASNGDYYFWGYTSSTIIGLFKSIDQGNSWIQINDLPTAISNFNSMKEINGNVIVATTQGIFAKTLQSNYSYIWSTGATTQSIDVNPAATTEYTLQTTYNNVATIDTILVTVFPITTSTQTQTAIDSYTWPVNGQTYTQSGQYSETLVNATGCDSIVTLNLTLSYTGIEQMQLHTSKKLLKITDLNGKETPFRKNTVLLFIYEDGTVERMYITE